MPSSLALVIIFACTFLTCYHVYSTERTTLKWSAKRNLSLTKKVCLQSFLYFIGFAVTIPCVMLNYYGNFRTNNHFGAFAAAAFFAPAQGFLNCLVYFHRASKGSQWNWSNLFGSCWRKGKPTGELPSTEDHPSSTPANTVTVQTVESSQDQPSEGRETSPSNEEIRQNSPHANTADSTVLSEENGMSEESHSDKFSAAHWLMETFEHSDESTQQAQSTRRPIARSFAKSFTVGRSLFRAASAPNGQTDVRGQDD